MTIFNDKQLLGDLNLSLPVVDASVSSSEYQERILSDLQTILNERFSTEHAAKRKYYIYLDRINFACPYCGDSMKSAYKKRGNIILLGKYANFFKCHNCGEFKRLDNFFTDFKKTMDLDAINYMISNIQDFGNFQASKYDMSIFMDMNNIEDYAIEREELKKHFKLVEVENISAGQWLKKREQHNFSRFLYSPLKNYIAVLNMTPKGKIFSLQRREFTGYNKYKTYRLKKLYEFMNKDSSVVPEEIDDISQIFNICLINFANIITLFEGPMDSFLFKNSIANLGANKSFIIDIPVRYFYDDDITGRKNALKQANNGSSVFLWHKFKQDMGLPNRRKWDLNDVYIWAKQNNKKIPNLNNYFLNDPLDIIDI